MPVLLRRLAFAWTLALAAAGAAVLAATPAVARSLVIYCSHDPDACELAARTFM